MDQQYRVFSVFWKRGLAYSISRSTAVYLLSTAELSTNTAREVRRYPRLLLYFIMLRRCCRAVLCFAVCCARVLLLCCCSSAHLCVCTNFFKMHFSTSLPGLDSAACDWRGVNSDKDASSTKCVSGVTVAERYFSFILMKDTAARMLFFFHACLKFFVLVHLVVYVAARLV